MDAIPGDIYTVWDHLLQSGDVCGVQKVPKRLMIVGKGLAVGDQGHLGYGQGGLDIGIMQDDIYCTFYFSLSNYTLFNGDVM